MSMDDARRLASRTEPLLAYGQSYQPRRRLQQRQHPPSRSTRGRRVGQQEIELSNAYRPPSAEPSTSYSSAQAVVAAPIQGRMVRPSAPAAAAMTTTSLSQNYRRQPQQRQRHGGRLRKETPNKDLSWDVCSHGMCCVQCIRTGEVGMVETCGRFEEIVGPGLYCGGVWPFTAIVARLTLRVQQLQVVVETKTRDDVFVAVTVVVLFRVLVERAYEAYYSLESVRRQMQTYVMDVVRSTIPRLYLQKVFLQNHEISDAVFTYLQSLMKDYGHEIVSTLMTEIRPNDKVRESMNEVEASRREKLAAPHKAEAEKVVKIKAAEAQAESMYLHGVGTANGRAAIVRGLKTSVQSRPEQHSASEAMDILLLSQWVDVLTSVGAQDIVLEPSGDGLLS